MMLAEYRCDAGNTECGKLGAGEKDDGQTTGYSSICGRSLVGWFNRPLEDGRMGRGCFFAQKEDEASATERHSVLMVDRNQSALLEMHTVYRKTDFDTTEKVKAFSGNLNWMADTYSTFLQHHKEADRSKMKAQKRSGTVRFHSQRNLNLHDACDASNEIYSDLMKKMPKTFNWASHFDSKWSSPVVDQGACGSCYGVAMLESLQSRANLHFFNALKEGGVPEDKWPGEAPVSLSVQAHLACNMFDQACQGGYPYNSAKWVSLNGVPTERCSPSVNSTHGEVNECPASCFTDQSQVLYARDNYGYVVGAYGSGCGEVHMMNSLLEQGPLMAAIEVTPEFSRGRGIVGESFLQTGRDHLQAGVPKAHHQHIPTQGANIIEAKFAIKAAESSSDTTHCPVSNQKLDKARLREELDNLARSMDRDGSVFSVKDDSTFFIDTSKVPDDVQGEDTNVWSVTRETLAKTFSTSNDCVHLEMAPLVDDGWEHTNHAILITGFGQEVVHDHVSFAETGDHTAKHTHTYWIVRNSWGPGYGDDGHSYVARSKNYGGLEHQGVDIQARFDVGMMASLLEPYQKYVQEGKELKYRAFPHSVNAKDELPMPSDFLSEMGFGSGGVIPLPLLQTSNTTEKNSQLFTIPELPAPSLPFARSEKHHHRHSQPELHSWGHSEREELQALKESTDLPQTAFVEMGRVPDARDIDITHPEGKFVQPLSGDALLDLELGVPAEARSDILKDGLRGTDTPSAAVPLLQKKGARVFA
jgi:C1A family cysteine protease